MDLEFIVECEVNEKVTAQDVFDALLSLGEVLKGSTLSVRNSEESKFEVSMRVPAGSVQELHRQIESCLHDILDCKLTVRIIEVSVPKYEVYNVPL